jgi:hypothetical protein
LVLVDTSDVVRWTNPVWYGEERRPLEIDGVARCVSSIGANERFSSLR